MTRRQILSLLAAQAAPVSYRNYSRCLPDYLRELAQKAYLSRNRELARLTNPAAIRARQEWVRETLWTLAGGMPERTPLNARSFGTIERAGFRIEKILYESAPDFPIPANLYIPSIGQPPYPGILFQMGHTYNGKAADTYQRCCQGLARLGFLVLAFDPMGQGERVYYPGSDPQRTRLRSSDDEHSTPGKQMLLTGDTCARLQLWDAMRSLDYLAAHPLADPKRLASTGQSGGATLTMLLAAVDERLTAAAVSMGNTENFACANFNPPGSSDDAEQNLVGSGPLGFDRWDLLYPLAPKPLLIEVSARDFFGTYSPSYLESGTEEFAKLKTVYTRLGAAGRIAWRETPLPHGLSYDSRLAVYNWFSKWFLGASKELTKEPPVEPEPDERLWVAPSGSVVKSFGGKTPFELNRRRTLARTPTALDRLLGVRHPAGALRATVLRKVPSRGIDIEAWEVNSDTKVWVPAWVFLPREIDPDKPVIVTLEPNGRNGRWQEGGLYQDMALAGYPVCAADVRGIGDLSPEFGRGAAHYARSHEDEENYAWGSLILGAPLIGQRTTDVLALIQALAGYPALADRKIRIAAQGKLTVPAIFAAGFSPRVDSLYLEGGLVSYRSLVDTEDYSYSFANFAPGLLRHTDLPEVIASLAPRAVTLAGSVEATGKTASEQTVSAIYKAATNVRILPDADWSAKRLVGQGHALPG
jgi:cephalosporin-C deacetylase-like acetyl esterase